VQAPGETSATAPTDRYERRIDYLRLSVTDRCNLRCRYCMPAAGVPWLRHDDILRYEEIERLATLAVSLGISKIRLTGGEPLVRRDLPYLCERIARLPHLDSLSLTTNGVLLPLYARDLYNSGVKRLNISLDTLNPGKFAAITGKFHFFQVWEGIHQAYAIGFHPIKLNVVVMRGINDDEINDLASLTNTYPFHVRFIELMKSLPGMQGKHFLPGDEILRRLELMDDLLPAHSQNSNGPARYYRFAGALGKIGLITPLSRHFCPTCNRLRVTADGKLRSCLFSREEMDLRNLLRGRAADEEIVAAIRQAVWNKPREHALHGADSGRCLNRTMSAIGG
jgi:GTP 3',8-cyclase